MSHGVTEIQDTAAPAFPPILSHNSGLEFHALSNQPLQRGRIPLQYGLAMAFQPAEYFRISHDPAFQRLVESGSELPIWQSGEHRRISQHCTRLVKTTHQILAIPQIDPCL